MGSHKGRGEEGEALAKSPFKSLPPALPSLLFAEATYKQICKRRLPTGEGLDGDAIRAQADGLTEAEAGRRLFELAAACREAGIDPESAARRHARRVQGETEALVGSV